MYSKGTLLALLALVTSLASATPWSGDRAGSATVYDPAGFGACGVANGPGDLVAGVSQEIFDIFGHQTNPNDNPVCGRSIIVHANGKSVTAKVEDKCGGCSTNSIILSRAAFSKLADPGVGSIDVEWNFV